MKRIDGVNLSQVTELNHVLQQKLVKSKDLTYNDKLEIATILYEIEAQYAMIKKSLQIPMLNATIFSSSVRESLMNVNFDSLFETPGLQFGPHLKQNDYQYWLLIHLLINDQAIRNSKKTLFVIIDEFIDRIKDESFSPGDIEFTGTGATRCKTNIRFAFNDLKEMGLVSLYDHEHKESWTLTYFGFFVAASFCINPVDRDRKPMSDKITSFDASGFYFRLNPHIGKRILELTNPEVFVSLVKSLQFANPDLEELAEGPRIFNDYFYLLQDITSNTLPDREKTRIMRQGLTELEEKYPLMRYMSSLSAKFKADYVMK